MISGTSTACSGVSAWRTSCGAAAPRGGVAAQRGFSLIEVLAAFVILALVATALFRLFSASLQNAAASAEWSRALLVAESQLDVAAAAQPLREQEDRGTEDNGRIRWTTKVAAYAPAGVDQDLARASEALAIRMFRVTVEVTFDGHNGKERTLSLATVRLGPKLNS
jgi:general secretion pathway protein I